MRIIHFFILILLSGCILAQEIEFSATATPNVLRVGDQFLLVYSSNQEIQELTLPETPDFEILGGPNVGHSQNFSSVNGKVTTSSTFQYTYFLRATKDGKFTIPPATTKFKNKSYKSNAVTVEVVKAAANNQSQSQTQQKTNASATTTGNTHLTDNDLFVRLVLDKRRAYIGEQILATVKIYTRKRLSGVDPNFVGPEFPGFFTEPVETPPLRKLEREVVDGEIYNTGILRRMVIIPQKSGEIVIPSFNLDVALLREYRRRISDPFFEDLTIPETEEIPVKLKSKPVTVNVEALPANAPGSFKGAVGKFTIQASVTNTKGKTHEPLTFKLIISGKGNLKLVNEVLFTVPSGIERYDPVINTRFNNALSGAKTFEYLLIPEHPGEFTIPPAEFSYFDSDIGKFTTLKTQSFKIYVSYNEGDSISGSGEVISKEEVQLLNQDIRYIKTNSLNLNKKDTFFGLTFGFYLIVLSLLIIYIGFLIIHKKRVTQRLDIKGSQFRSADRYARKRLKHCYSLLKQGNDAAFYEELLGAIWNYLSYKLDIPMAILSKDSAERKLAGRNVERENLDRLFYITDTCEMARYGHVGEIDKEQLYKNALQIITTLQQRLR